MRTMAAPYGAAYFDKGPWPTQLTATAGLVLPTANGHDADCGNHGASI